MSFSCYFSNNGKKLVKKINRQEPRKTERNSTCYELGLNKITGLDKITATNLNVSLNFVLTFM